MQAHVLIALLLLGTVLAVPNFYDGRDEWKACLTSVYDQNTCISSLAHAIAGTISDRYCIKHNNNKPYLSPQDLVCTFKPGTCAGTLDVAAAFNYATLTGLRNRECLPYAGNETTEACPEKCTTSIADTRIKCGAMVTLSTAADIKNAIMNKGPVVCAFPETIDYQDYYEGVYYVAHTKKRYSSPSGVKLIGWGIENGLEYWIAENSLSDDFGENGYARIKTSICTVAYTCDPE